MYPSRPALEIGVEGAGGRTRMLGVFLMEPDEMLAVEGQNRPSVADGEREDLLVGDGPPGVARLLGGEYVVAKPTKLLYDGQGEILVRVQVRHLGQASSLSRICSSISSGWARA